MGSFMFGYANNANAGSFVQTSFVQKLLSDGNADSVIGGILGAYVLRCSNSCKEISLVDFQVHGWRLLGAII